MTHRVAYRLWTGDLIPGMQIDHLCSNRACCNPDHLEQVTPIVNRLRASPRATHCGKGHDMAVDRYPGGGCRACCKIRNEAWRDRRRQLRAAA